MKYVIFFAAFGFFFLIRAPRVIIVQIFLLLYLAVLPECMGEFVEELNNAGLREKHKTAAFWYKLLKVDRSLSIPKSIITFQYALLIQVVFFSFFLWFFWFYYRSTFIVMDSLSMVIPPVTSMIVVRYEQNEFFYKKFKRINIYNLRYYLFGESRFKKAVVNHKIGRCTVVGEETVRGKQYFVVEVKKTGIKYEKVMYCGAESIQADNTYTLYEIKEVYYIT